MEYITRHRNPLFDNTIGISMATSITIDVLHCVYLGVLLTFCRHVVWMLIVNHVWCVSGTTDEVLELSALAIRNDLKVFYRARRLSHPDENITRIGNFTKKNC
jgi:hypothetical protein